MVKAIKAKNGKQRPSITRPHKKAFIVLFHGNGSTC
jgi:hypothetical protein